MEASPVGFKIKADLRVLRKAHVAIDDRPADPRVTANVDVVIDDGGGYFAEAVDAHVVADQAILNSAAGKNRTAANNRVERNAFALFVRKNEFCRRILLLPGAQWPILVVKVENRGNAD